MSITGKLPEPGRADQILADADKYFAEARKRNRRAILAERAAQRRRGRKARLA